MGISRIGGQPSFSNQSVLRESSMENQLSWDHQNTTYTNNVISAEAVSDPALNTEVATLFISRSNVLKYKEITFTKTLDGSDTITVDILDENDGILHADIASGFLLDQINPNNNFKMRFTFNRADAANSTTVTNVNLAWEDRLIQSEPINYRVAEATGGRGYIYADLTQTGRQTLFSSEGIRMNFKIAQSYKSGLTESDDILVHITIDGKTSTYHFLEGMVYDYYSVVNRLVVEVEVISVSDPANQSYALDLATLPEFGYYPAKYS